jgi:hypothetical protein
MEEPRWDDLDPAQADGLACVICTRDFLRHPTPRIPVGRSVTGSQVMACAGSCAQRAALSAWRLRIPDEAWTAAGIAFLTALEQATTTGGVRDAYPDDLITPTVRAAAGLIVAAELRRLATHHQPCTDPSLSYAQRHHREGIEWVCAALTDRAQELDPAGGAR